MGFFIGHYHKVMYRWGDLLATTISIVIDRIFY